MNSPSKKERIRSIKNGNGIQHILSEAYEILGNPILVHDMEYKALEMTKNIITDDPIWNEYAMKGTVSYEWLLFFRDECFLEEAANAKQIIFLTSDKLKYNRVFGKLFNKNNIQVGCAVLLACDKPFDDDDPVLFDALCAVISAELSRDHFFTEYGQAYFEKLVKELVGGIDDIALYAAHVESIYLHLKSNLYLAVADIGHGDHAYAQLAHYRDMFKEIQPEYAYAIYDKYILIIISTDDEALYVEKDLSQLNQLFKQENIHMGISRPFENLFEMNKHYRDALDVLSSGLEVTSRRIFIYNQHGGE